MSSYGSFSLFYDSLTDNAEYERRCDYLCGLFKENGISSGILLDLACGTGTVCEIMSARGFDVIGVDSSQEMLNFAMEKRFESGRDILYLCQDMAELDLYGTINCAVCTLDSINHVLSPKKVESAFEKVGLFMEKGGVFIFDVNTEYKHRKILGNNTFVYDLDDVYCVWQNTVDEKTAKVHIDLDLFAPNDDESYERYTEEFDEVIYTEEQLTGWLKKAGFEVAGIYEEFTHDKVKSDTQRAVFVCRKAVQTNRVFEEMK